MTLITLGAVAVIWGLVRGNDAGWSSSEVIGSFVARVFLIGGFAVWELRTPVPLYLRTSLEVSRWSPPTQGFLMVAGPDARPRLGVRLRRQGRGGRKLHLLPS